MTIIEIFILSVAMAIDALIVSFSYGLIMDRKRLFYSLLLALSFGFFQFLMPMIGWICVHTAAEKFKMFEKLIPWIALVLLLFIGGKMLIEGIKNKSEQEEASSSEVGIFALLLQGVATSIDALSVGFTISDYGYTQALTCCAVIAAVTFIICMAGVAIGKRFGMSLAEKASVLGGAILIFIGLEIFITGVF